MEFVKNHNAQGFFHVDGGLYAIFHDAYRKD